MNSREHFEFMKKAVPQSSLTAEAVIKSLAEGLIKALYIPVEGESVRRVDKSRLTHFGVDDTEPVNWGDLGCSEVRQSPDGDGTFILTVEEAAPRDCESLCEYIETYLYSYGWECKVETEW